jgi:hypothetical protein
MANDVFDIALDLSIRYFNQTLSAYVDIVADSFEVDIDRGIQVEQGVFATGAVGVATVKLVKKNLADFLGTPGYKAGDLFDIRYRPTPDTAPTTYNTIYAGYIQNVSMGYINESGTLEITIVANDVMRYYMNQVLPTYSSPSGTVTQRSFRNCMISLNSALSTASTFSPSGTILNPLGAGASSTTQLAYTWVNEPAGVILERFLNAELGWAFGSKSSPNTVSYLARTDIDTKKAVTYNSANPTVSNVHFTNLLANGTFETNTTGWSSGSGVTLSRVTSQFYMGVASMRVHGGGSSTSYITNNTSTGSGFAVGTKLKASMWVKSESGNQNATIAIRCTDFSGLTVYETFTSAVTAVNASGWTEVTVTGVVPTGTQVAALRVTGIKSGSGANAIYIDNVKLENLTTISANHFCLDSINLSYDSDILVNRAVVVDNMTGTRTVASNTTSINTNGLRADEFPVNLDPAGASTYATLASRIANAATLKQVYGVVVPPVRDDGKIGTIANFEIGDTIQVEFAQDPLPALQVVTLISRINHVITPQHWEMNISLWRGI